MSDASIWNDYWHADRLASCEALGETNYVDEIAGGWERFFQTLPTGAAILDLCTGNGAIAVMAAEAGARAGRNFRITGVDAADINPCLHVTRQRDRLAAIDFVPGTPVEWLPWPSGSFDAVVSQYGIEYSDLSRSIPELARVVAPGARVRLFLHAAEGALVQRSRRAVLEIDWLLHEIDLAAKARACLRAVTQIERNMDRSEKTLCAAREKSAAFQKALQDTRDRMAGAADPHLLWNAGKMLVELYQHRRDFDPARAMGMIEGIRTEWRNHRARLTAQIQAAVSRDERGTIVERLRASGATWIAETEESASGAVIGHCIEACF